MALYGSRLGVGHASLRSRYWLWPAAAGIGWTVWRARLLDVLFKHSGRFRLLADTVEKLRFEISSDFICDLSVVLYSRYDGGVVEVP